jgi:hypothetical protein
MTSADTNADTWHEQQAASLAQSQHLQWWADEDYEYLLRDWEARRSHQWDPGSSTLALEETIPGLRDGSGFTTPFNIDVAARGHSTQQHLGLLPPEK